MRTDGVLDARGFRRVNVESRWNVDSWGALWVFLGMSQKEEPTLQRPFHVLKLSISFWPYVTKGRLENNMV